MRDKLSIKKISQWTRYRDEHIHGMFNKDLDELRAGYRSHVEQGYKLAREFDKYVGRIKDA